LRCLALVIAALAFAWTSQGACYAGPITYTLDDYPTLQNGDHLSGTIMTDGTLGSINASNILGWSFTITSTGGTILAAGSSSGGYDFFDGDIRTTLSAIFFDVPSSQPAADEGMVFQSIVGEGPYLSWQWLLAKPASAYQGGTLGSQSPAQQFWNSPFTPGTSFEVASVPASAVPEPATLTLLLVGLGGLVAVRLAQRRRAAAPAPAVAVA
jgi:hypothetical protein